MRFRILYELETHIHDPTLANIEVRNSREYMNHYNNSSCTESF